MFIKTTCLRQVVLFFCWLCVDPRYQSQGIARTLMKFAERTAKAFEYQAIRLDAFVNNERACQFYRKLGYQVAGTVENSKNYDFFCDHDCWQGGDCPAESGLFTKPISRIINGFMNSMRLFDAQEVPLTENDLIN